MTGLYDARERPGLPQTDGAWRHRTRHLLLEHMPPEASLTELRLEESVTEVRILAAGSCGQERLVWLGAGADTREALRSLVALVRLQRWPQR